MTGKKEHALMAGQGPLVVLETLINHRLAHVLAGISREQANLGNMASERGKDTAQNLLAFPQWLFRKREFEVAHAHSAQFSVEKVDEPRNGDPGSPGQGSRKSAYKLDESPRQRVFESVAQGKADGSRGEISVSNGSRPNGESFGLQAPGSGVIHPGAGTPEAEAILLLLARDLGPLCQVVKERQSALRVIGGLQGGIEGLHFPVELERAFAIYFDDSAIQF